MYLRVRINLILYYCYLHTQHRTHESCNVTIIFMKRIIFSSFTFIIYHLITLAIFFFIHIHQYIVSRILGSHNLKKEITTQPFSIRSKYSKKNYTCGVRYGCNKSTNELLSCESRELCTKYIKVKVCH